MIPAPQPAGAKPRTLAGLTDLGLVTGYVVVLAMLIALVFPYLTGPTPVWAGVMLAWLFIEVPVGVWWWRQESVTGTTIGKRLMGLRVVRLGTTTPASPLRCAVRTVGKILPWAIVHLLVLVATDAPQAEWWSVPALTLVAALGLVSILAAFVRLDHCAAYDLLAGTQVITADSGN